MTREPRFFVIKAQQHSRKWVFSGMFGSKSHRGRSKMTTSKISRFWPKTNLRGDRAQKWRPGVADTPVVKCFRSLLGALSP